LEQEIAVRHFLSGNRVQDEQGFAQRQRLTTCEAAWLGDDNVGNRHPLVHVGDEAQYMRGMPAVLATEFAAQIEVAADHNDGLKLAGRLVERREDVAHGSDAEYAAQYQDRRQVVA